MMNDNATNNSNRINEDLHMELSLLKQQNAELLAKLKWFEEQILLGRNNRFGMSVDKVQYIGQLDISSITDEPNVFNEAEVTANIAEKEPEIEEITYKRRKKSGSRQEKFENIPAETIEYTLEGKDLECPQCGGERHVMGQEVTSELVVIPAQLKVINHVRHKYGCRDCEKNEITTPIDVAPMPKRALPGSPASASAIAYIMTLKFVDSMPLYRQEKHFERLGISFSRQTMSNWMLMASEKWLKILYERMKEHLLSKDILHADETRLQVLREPERTAEKQSYMWLYRTGRDGPPIILFEYQTTRSGKHPKKFLADFKGYLHVDGYGGYECLTNVILCACWAHSRRKFCDALKILPVGKRDADVASNKGLEFCNKLFEIEKILKDEPPEKRYLARIEKSKPVLDEFREWLNYHSARALPKSTFGKAVKYCRNQWHKLTAFLKDGRLEIDNNRSERSIKPFVIGRKNFLFCNTPRGANASATIYSIVETAKENGLNPFQYLKYLFEKMPNIDIEDKSAIDELMPWSTALPDVCRIQK